jgi:hypothetical protein
VEQRKRRGGRFCGRRVNCEGVPLLPAWAVAWMLDDPRKIPYLLVWKSEHDGEIKEDVRIARDISHVPPFDLTGWIEIKRHDGTSSFVRPVLCPLPRNGGRVRLLTCPYCQTPRRALYGWRPGGQYTSSAVTCSWQCRSCAGLRYASEGGALVSRGGPISRLLRMPCPDMRHPRPEPWLPYVFTSPEEAAEAGVCELSSVSWYGKR